MILLQRAHFRGWRVGTKLLVLIVPLLALVTVMTAWGLHERNTAKLTEKLTQRARSLHTQIMADREYYAAVILPRVLTLGGSLGEDYRRVHGRFPLPATFVREVSERTAIVQEGYKANLISPWPINKDKGLTDQFQRDAFATLTANPAGHFFRTDTSKGRAVMRVILADRASAQSCVTCHNAHPQSPKHDFRLNDLMGGLEIEMPMDQYLKESQQDLLMTVGGGTGLCLLVVGIVAFGARQTVTRPLATLASRMREISGTREAPPPETAVAPPSDEVTQLTATFEQMQAVIAAQQTQLEDANVRLEAQVIELKTVNEELEAFSYSVSHDLRAPLRAMDGLSKILFEEFAPQMSKEVQRYLQMVRDNAQQMDQLVNDLLHFSRLGRQPLTRQAVAPADLVRQVLRDLRSEQEGRKVEITIEDLPVCQADQSMLKQVFVNLLSNALKFTRHREVGVITIGCRTEGSKNIYFVKDNGVGFETRYANKLFGVFQRLHRAEDYEGTGVGLAIVQRIIHRHGGQVWAEAEVNNGATFYFTLTRGLSHD